MHCSCKQDIWGVGRHFCASQIMPFRQPHRRFTLGATDLLCTQWNWALKDAGALKHLFLPKVSLIKVKFDSVTHNHKTQILLSLCNCVCIEILFFLKKEMGRLMCIHDKGAKIGDLNAFNSAWESRNRWMYASSRRKKKNLSIRPKLLSGWVHLIPLNKINKKKLYSNNPPLF